jgi:amino acid transporter
MNQKKKHLTVWALIMINLAALGGIRSWAPIAECGFSSIFFLLLAGIGFFIPVSLIAAELATSIPEEGGVYAWVKKAFGHKLGFMAIWLLWVENVMWYPTVLSFIASAVTFAFDASLIQNRMYIALLVMAIFWGTTLINLKGIRASTWLSSIGAICGTFIAGSLIIVFGLIWFLGGHPLEISLTKEALLPNIASSSQIALLAGVVLSFLGIEMSAVHAAEVHNPQQNYPRAIFFTAFIVLLFSGLGVLSIAAVVPKEQIILSAGGLQAFQIFFAKFGLDYLLPVMSVIVALGALGSMSTWVVGPCTGLIAAAEPHDLPAFLRKTSSKGVPKNLLLFQAVLVTILSFLFIFMPTVNSAYWMFVVLTTQLYLIMYILLFAAAIKLRYTEPHLARPFKVPGGLTGMWVLGGAGILSALFAALVCFFPSSQVAPGSEWGYVTFLALSILLFSTIPYWRHHFRKKENAALAPE